MLTMLIINLLHHSECVCTMSTYSNVSTAGSQLTRWKHGLGLGAGKCGMGRSAAKGQGSVSEFYVDFRVVRPLLSGRLYDVCWICFIWRLLWSLLIPAIWLHYHFALWSSFSPYLNSVSGQVSTMWFMVCHWPQSQEGDWTLSLIHIWRCRRIERCRSRWSPYH